ncbi:nucleotidyl transferase AbiEii/AbiGii toxin family protein [Dinghuibacter silviterrae]|uniref:Nucleotidyltransferase AbiEii toxin of type IV toxin-antitoxin system n=1 Tax=Dinghuibacter silviterrae TaxID=1539049 RepID=A0A4R8DS86_9BACT|nr:nucleotidyl transferase AbiEii/AbiGii toxin family protein [Dinghuibacter silviterrae]TDX00275.1 nucleotidyltransferase AbiEii toxin of type IV toxin-antitoxin system [Dinghuibacter silviterrae]
MPLDYLHNHKEFPELLRIVGDQMGILPALIEKDYWIMHVLYGLKQQGFDFEMKGGTSLSKGFKIIDRFSEDIDIYIHPPPDMGVEENWKKDKPIHVESRQKYFEWLAGAIKIGGINDVQRDKAFDNKIFTSAGIRLYYPSHTEPVDGLKPGILLEVGFDTVTPNEKLSISSWALDLALNTISGQIVNNTATDISCYQPGYTLVEKLQTIVRKFRREQETGEENPNYMRQYYDVSRLLLRKEVQAFIGTKEYQDHKAVRIKGKDNEIPLLENEAFLLSDPKLRKNFAVRYAKTASLYYKGQLPFEELLAIIQENLPKL